ncbi:hypothetical protein [Thermasporomyces composti]|jgi:hypothetical protein|uniref:Uncharacterized protein n=1 Tax=Thermasporomyces composti TaxID=696763 RepID=A0A3D9VCF4_THECX|nr:hypothetical protein [Thermasporomyces composti]REF35854.1 hypothetical protein DFJ64_1246 [Thermasporomyces composti]
MTSPAGTASEASPLAFLAAAVDSYAPYLQESGELHDPVFGEPTQYGTAYHAYCNAVLATVGPAERRAWYLDRALRGLEAALAHTGDPDLPAAASGFDRATGAVSRGNHRDFTWPPILKSYRLLKAEGRAAALADRIAAVDIERSFRSRPPSNWASVWLSGEWIRIQQQLSPFTVDDVDAWLDVFFEDLLRPDDGFYFEPGKPNSYDLFTRFHVADLLREGYDGRWRETLERLMVTGLERSLAVQMSDGSLASAHRSTGQTWTVGAQVAYFTYAAEYFGRRGDSDRASRAAEAARRAFASLRRWRRSGDVFSPVENVLPPGYRVGYERYTADAHYGNLALAFLASAILAGFTDAGRVPAERSPTVRVEGAPTFRGVAHAGRYSIAVNADPAPQYDGFGITDLTVGPDRYLQFASSVRHVESGRFFNLGTALRSTPGRSPLDVLAQRTFTLREPLTPLEGDGSRGLRLRAHTAGGADGSTPELDYELAVTVEPTGVHVEEATPGHTTYRTLLVPYPRDVGTGVITQVQGTRDGIRLLHGGEEVDVTVDAEIEAITSLPYGYENRRGLCGLVRIDLREPADRVRFRLAVVR